VTAEPGADGEVVVSNELDISGNMGDLVLQLKGRRELGESFAQSLAGGGRWGCHVLTSLCRASGRRRGGQGQWPCEGDLELQQPKCSEELKLNRKSAVNNDCSGGW
jgi:hypothetical protein